MLNKESIHQLLVNPNGISDKDTQHLEEILKDYPFASTLHLLYLKGLKNTQHLSYEKQLSKTSIKSPNREVLYQLIIQEDLKEIIAKEIEEIESDTLEAQSENTTTDPSKTEEELEPVSTIANELEETILSEISSYSIDYKIDESQKEKEDIIEKTPEKQSFSSWLNTVEKGNKSTLIDNFISINPSITPNKLDVYSTPKLAKLKTIEDNGLVTETLARIYMKQGHFDKAIKTYQKLSLKIPEKKAFFASQIEVIQELKKQE